MTSFGLTTSTFTPMRMPPLEQPPAIKVLTSLFDSLSLIHHRAESALEQFKHLQGMNAQTFGAELFRVLGSSATTPDTVVAQTILVESMLHIEAQTFSLLQQALPYLSRLEEALSQVNLAESLHAASSRRAIETIRLLPSETEALSIPEKLRRYTSAITSLKHLTSPSQQLLQYIRDTLTETPESLNLGVLTERYGDDVLRQAIIAIDLYERSRSPASTTGHYFPSGESAMDLSSPMSFFNLPAIYQLNLATIRQCLTDILRDDALADTLTNSLHESVLKHQTLRIIVQDVLTLTEHELSGVESRVPLDELEDILEQCSHSEITKQLLRHALVDRVAGLTSIDELRAWTTALSSYINNLSLAEQIIAGLSPWLTPQQFLSREKCEARMKHLQELRASPQGHAALFRVAAQAALSSHLKTSDPGKHSSVCEALATICVYGFGSSSATFQHGNSPHELTKHALLMQQVDLSTVIPEHRLKTNITCEATTITMLEIGEKTGLFIKKRPSGSDISTAEYTLAPSTSKIHDWASVLKLVGSIRTSNFDEKYLAPLATSFRHVKQESTLASKGKRQVKMPKIPEFTEKKIDKINAELEALDEALCKLSAISMEHILKRQVDAIVTGASRIRDGFHQLYEDTGTLSIPRGVSAALNLLTPRHAINVSSLGEFVRTGRAAICILKYRAHDQSAGGFAQ